MPADIRFPLERANGVQIVKTAAALARAGARTHAAACARATRARRPRSSPSTASRPHPGLRVRRLQRAAPPRLLRAAARVASSPAPPWPPGPPCAAARWCFTRDLQLADVLLRAARRAARRLRGARGGGAHVRASAAALYGTAEKADPAQGGAPARAARGACGAGAAAVVTTTAGIRDSFAEALRRARRACTWCPNGCDVPPTARSPACPTASRRASSTRASSIPGRAWTCWWRRWRAVPRGAARDPGRDRRARRTPRACARSCDACGLAARMEMPGTCPRRAWRTSCARARGGGGAVPAHGHDASGTPRP